MSHIDCQQGYYCNENFTKESVNGQLTAGEKTLLIIGAYAVLAMVFFMATL